MAQRSPHQRAIGVSNKCPEHPRAECGVRPRAGRGGGRLSWAPHELSHAGPPMSGAASAASSSSCEVRSRRSSAACCCVSWARCSSSAAGTAPSCSWMAAISRPARPPAGTPKQHVSLG